MKMEVVEFYPIIQSRAGKNITGTLTVKLNDTGFLIRGILFNKVANSWYIQMPWRTGFDSKLGKDIKFLCFVLENAEENREFQKNLRETCMDYVIKRMNDLENPVIFPDNHPLKIKKDANIALQKKQREESENKKKVIKVKEFIDLPLRNKNIQTNRNQTRC